MQRYEEIFEINKMPERESKKELPEIRFLAIRGGVEHTFRVSPVRRSAFVAHDVTVCFISGLPPSLCRNPHF
jgi:hypothetical protein